MLVKQIGLRLLVIHHLLLGLSCRLSKVASPPPSPLTEPEDSISSLPGVHVILVLPPNTNVNVKNAGWPHSLKTGYRKTAREAVDQYLDTQHRLSKQTQIKDELPAFRDHQNHWGADTLLQDQLKSKKDTETKVEKREAEKREGDKTTGRKTSK
ncbi:hypothetical protein BT96DRAFT_946583 [Gymnopus androsaceus JB14]|uniref:Uncharacterized protein n=1 Tax=Gymnopus androsaceus JB14 TaxID=1447944 RepID=A0A6A4GVE2_9AGAR|nr:hypothetical protein BT96DRAFT_946583 [Gymnopus androsaceus JB14]